MFFFYLIGSTELECRLLPLLTLDTLIITTDFFIWDVAHGGCDWSTDDFYLSLVSDTLSNACIFRDPCLTCSQIYISYRTYEIDDCSLFMLFHKTMLLYTRNTDYIPHFLLLIYKKHSIRIENENSVQCKK
jgi:hypothetical protein